MIGKTLIDMIKTISTSSHNIKLISEIKNRNKAKQILAPVTEYLNQNYRRMASH